MDRINQAQIERIDPTFTEAVVHNESFKLPGHAERMKAHCKRVTKALGGNRRRTYKISEETRRKMSIAHKGKKHTEEAKRKMSKSHEGKNA